MVAALAIGQGHRRLGRSCAIAGTMLLCGTGLGCLPADAQYLIKLRVTDATRQEDSRVLAGVGVAVKWPGDRPPVERGITAGDGTREVWVVAPPRFEPSLRLQLSRDGYHPAAIPLSAIVSGVRTACLLAEPCEGEPGCWRLEVGMVPVASAR